MTCDQCEVVPTSLVTFAAERHAADPLAGFAMPTLSGPVVWST